MRARSVKLAGQPGLAILPVDATWLYVLAHGAGAGMRHWFLADIAAALAERSIATVRWDLPFMAAGRARPDSPAVSVAAVRAVCTAAAARWPALRLVAGGKSFGGRMTSTAAAAGALPRVEGLAFLGFPLHPPDRREITRADHLAAVAAPMLFVQGTRDDLAELSLLRPVVAGLAPRARLVEIAGADHGFEVQKRSGRTQPEVITEIAATVATWISTLPRPHP